MIRHLEIDISIIIVNYKTPKLLLNCIESITKNKNGLAIEIIVVDNDSKDESESLINKSFPEVIWINSGYNSGFSRANNIGIKKAEGNYILLLNSDTIIIDDCLAKTLDRYKNFEKNKIKIGLLGCKMKDLNEQILFNSNNYFPGIKKLIKANAFYIWLTRRTQKSQKNIGTERLKDHCRDHQSAWIGLAFALCNRKLFDEKNLFLDEDFFMYSEDVEWCSRLSKRKYKHFFYSDVEIYHVNCGSSTSISEWKTAQIIISEWLYLYKTRGFLYFQIYIVLLKFNLFIDNLLHLRSSKNNKSNTDDILSSNPNKLIATLASQYIRKIKQNYKSKPSSGTEFLKYYVQ